MTTNENEARAENLLPEAKFALKSSGDSSISDCSIERINDHSETWIVPGRWNVQISLIVGQDRGSCHALHSQSRPGNPEHGVGHVNNIGMMYMEHMSCCGNLG